MWVSGAGFTVIGGWGRLCESVVTVVGGLGRLCESVVTVVGGWGRLCGSVVTAALSLGVGEGCVGQWCLLELSLQFSFYLLFLLTQKPYTLTATYPTCFLCGLLLWYQSLHQCPMGDCV